MVGNSDPFRFRYLKSFLFPLVPRYYWWVSEDGFAGTDGFTCPIVSFLEDCNIRCVESSV